jgi:hypothetical protein
MDSAEAAESGATHCTVPCCALFNVTDDDITLAMGNPKRLRLLLEYLRAQLHLVCDDRDKQLAENAQLRTHLLAMQDLRRCYFCQQPDAKMGQMWRDLRVVHVCETCFESLMAAPHPDSVPEPETEPPKTPIVVFEQE